jgi:hypothetical protein
MTTNYEEIIEKSAQYINHQMSISGRLGETLAAHGFDPASISKDDIHAIFVKTMMLLQDEWEKEDTEYEDDGGDEGLGNELRYLYNDDDYMD